MEILLIDDSRFVRVTVKKYIKSIVGDEWTFFEADCGEKGITLFKERKPNLVFLDLLMPDMNGEDVLKEIKKQDESCYVVILSSNFQKPVRERLLSLGANLFVDKSITTEKISNIIDAFNAYVR
jgi:two-component system, chemotaxis family, chemotaxis protein CheY